MKDHVAESNRPLHSWTWKELHVTDEICIAMYNAVVKVYSSVGATVHMQ